MKINNYSDVFASPFFLMLVVSVLTLTVNLLFFSRWNYSHTIYAIGSISFLAAYAYVILVFRSKSVAGINPRLNLNLKILKIYSYLGIIGATIGVVIISIRGFKGVEGLFFNLRHSHIQEQQSLYGASHFALFALVVAAVNFLNKSYKRAFVFFVLYLIPSLASAERTSILYGFSFLIYLGISRRQIKLRVIFLSILILILIFVLIAASSGKLYVDEIFFLLPYFGYGITAFDEWVLRVPSNGCTGLILGSFGKILDLFFKNNSCSGIELAPNGLFNVYTYIAEPYLWGGINGVFAVMSMLGFIYGLLKIREKNSVYFLMINASLVFSVVMTFYAWTFSLTTHLYMIFILIPLFYRFNFVKSSLIKYRNV